MFSITNLDNKHGLGRDLHVVTQFEVTKKHECLWHADITIGLESHISKRLAWINIPNNQLCNHIKPRLLQDLYN